MHCNYQTENQRTPFFANVTFCCTHACCLDVQFVHVFSYQDTKTGSVCHLEFFLYNLYNKVGFTHAHDKCYVTPQQNSSQMDRQYFKCASFGIHQEYLKYNSLGTGMCHSNTCNCWSLLHPLSLFPRGYEENYFHCAINLFKGLIEIPNGKC